MTRRVLVIVMVAAASVAAARVVIADDKAPAKPAPANPRPAAKLQVTGLEPTRGDAEGGTYVLARGAGFTDATDVKVYFGAAQGTLVRVASDGELIVQAPGGKVGLTVDVLFVFQGRGEIKVPAAFTFVAKKP